MKNQKFTCLFTINRNNSRDRLGCCKCRCETASPLHLATFPEERVASRTAAHVKIVVGASSNLSSRLCSWWWCRRANFSHEISVFRNDTRGLSVCLCLSRLEDENFHGTWVNFLRLATQMATMLSGALGIYQERTAVARVTQREVETN